MKCGICAGTPSPYRCPYDHAPADSTSIVSRVANAILSVGTIDRCCSELAAKAVIRELGLHRQDSYGYGTNYPQVPTIDVKYIRYITDWIRNE